MKFGLTALLAGGVAVVGVAAGLSVSNPDSAISNTLQTNRRGKLPVTLERYDDQQPLGDRVAVPLIHGWSNEGDVSALPSEQSVRDTFSAAVLDWRARAPEVMDGVPFDSCFVLYIVRYPPQTDLEKNSRSLWDAVEADGELTMEGAVVLPYCHSMGCLVAKGYRNIDDHKCIGLIANGGPFGGSPLSDPVLIEAGLTKRLGRVSAAAIMKEMVARVDFSLPGIRCLRPDSLTRMRLMAEDPMDDSCYVFYGRIDNGRLDPISMALDLTDGLDLVMTPGANNVKSAVIYARLGNLIDATGWGESDGMVPVKSALHDIGGAHSVTASDYDHSEIVRGAGETWLHDQQLRAMWEIYQSRKKSQKGFGQYDWPIPALPVEGLTGFGSRVHLPISLWAVDGEVVAYEDQAGWVRTGIRVPLGCEVDVDSGGTLVAVPTSDGAMLYNMAEESCVRLTERPATAVGWTGENLLVAEEGRLLLISPKLRIARVLVEDDSLSVASRIVADSKQAWFVSGEKLYRIGLAAVRLNLASAQVEVIEEDVRYRPRPTKHGLVGMWQDGTHTKVAWSGRESLGLEKTTSVLLQNLVTDEVLKAATDIAITQDGDVLMLVDEKVRLIRKDTIAALAREGVMKDLRSRLDGSEVRLPYTLDQIAPALGDQHATSVGAR